MNSMGAPQPQNKLQAMMQGLMGGQQGGPAPSGPTANQPTGIQQPNDPAYSGFVKIKQGMMGLADLLQQLGDNISSNQVQELATELMKLGEARSSDLIKKMELDQKLGSTQMMGTDTSQQGGY